ncbi:MAG: hypothetical protein ACLGH0_14125, partial [Thermoanaerobaculia bacterium]
MKLARRLAKLFALDLNRPAIARDPYPHYERLRRKGPVQFLPKHDGWIVLGYDEVQSVFARPNAFSNSPYADIDPLLLGADAPAHTAARRSVMHLFSAERLERLTRFAEQHALSLLQPQMDAVTDYARPLSEAVATELLRDFEADARLVRLLRLAATHTAERTISRCILML